MAPEALRRPHTVERLKGEFQIVEDAALLIASPPLRAQARGGSVRQRQVGTDRAHTPPVSWLAPPDSPPRTCALENRTKARRWQLSAGSSFPCARNPLPTQQLGSPCPAGPGWPGNPSTSSANSTAPDRNRPCAQATFRTASFSRMLSGQPPPGNHAGLGQPAFRLGITPRIAAGGGQIKLYKRPCGRDGRRGGNSRWLEPCFASPRRPVLAGPIGSRVAARPGGMQASDSTTARIKITDLLYRGGLSGGGGTPLLHLRG